MRSKWDNEFKKVSRGLGRLYPVKGRTITIPKVARVTVEDAQAQGVRTIDVPRTFLAELVTVLRTHDMEDCPKEVFEIAKSLSHVNFANPDISSEVFLDDVEAAALVAEVGGTEVIEEMLQGGKSPKAVAKKLGLPLWIVLDYDRYT